MTASVTLSTPPRFNELWDWIVAVDAYDHGNASLLGKQIQVGAVPDEIRPILADIVMGMRKPNRKAASKLKIPAGERMRVAASVCCLLELIDIIMRGAANVRGVRPGVENIAHQQGREPIEVKRKLEADAREVVQRAAIACGVSTETIENLVRDFRKRVKQFPAI